MPARSKPIVDQVIAANPKSVEEYRAGKEKAFNALVGQAMKATRGKGNPAQINEILKRKAGQLTCFTKQTGRLGRPVFWIPAFAGMTPRTRGQFFVAAFGAAAATGAAAGAGAAGLAKPLFTSAR